MLPSLAAEDLRSAISAYLTTSFALGDDDVRDELGAFLERPESRLFRGPYLRVRAPFREAPRGWQKHLDWWPKGFAPYTHQATACGWIDVETAAAAASRSCTPAPKRPDTVASNAAKSAAPCRNRT